MPHNKHDFKNMAGDERKPYPDLADLFLPADSTYHIAIGGVLNDYAQS